MHNEHLEKKERKVHGEKVSSFMTVENIGQLKTSNAKITEEINRCKVVWSSTEDWPSLPKASYQCVSSVKCIHNHYVFICDLVWLSDMDNECAKYSKI